MCFAVKFTRKMWDISLVTRRLYANAAIWDTTKSSLKGWSLACPGPAAVRLVTPLFGFGAGIWIGESR